MSAYADQIHAGIAKGWQDFSECLRGICVQPCGVVFEQIRDLVERLNHAGFIIRVHQRHEPGLGTQGFGKRRRLHPSVGIWRKKLHVKSPSRQFFHWFDYRLVLDLCGEDVPASRSDPGRCESENRQIVALRRATRENNFLPPRCNDRRDSVTGRVHGLLGTGSVRVRPAAFVSKLVLPIRAHGFPDFRFHRGRCVTVEIDRCLHVFEIVC